MLSRANYEFSKCIVLGGTREVFLQGEIQELPPRAFDLLLYLLKHRDRVVTKHEILEEIWLGRTVTDNVVSRAIMLARTAVGDSKSSPGLIKTVQRVGYRFAGQVRTFGDPTPALPFTEETISGEQVQIRVAVLPFRNDTGQEELAWTELGLPTLVSQALRAGAAIQVLATSAILHALDDRPQTLNLKEVAQHVLKCLGANCVIETHVTRSNAGYALEFSAYGDAFANLRGRVQGRELTALAQSLADMIGHRLFGPSAQVNRFDSADPFVNECLARGMQALNKQDAALAVDLLRVVHKMEPNSTAASLAYLQALNAAGAPEGLEFAQELIERYQKSGDVLSEGTALNLLARIYLEDQRDAKRADEVLDRCLTGTPPNPMQDWYVEALLTRALARNAMGDRKTARETLAQAIAFCDQASNPFMRIGALNSKAVLEAKDGNSWMARDSFRSVLETLEGMDRPLSCGLAQSNLAVTSFNLGLIDEAVTAAEGAMRRLFTVPAAPQKSLNAIAAAAFLFSQNHQSLKIAPLIGCFEEGAWAETTSPDAPVVALTRAFESVSRGELKKAGPLFLGAADKLIDANLVRPTANWLTLAIINLILAGEAEQARQLRAFIDDDCVHRFPWIESQLLHADAIAASLAGDALRACELLESALNVAQSGFAEAAIRVDLAWCYLFSVRQERALAISRPIGTWLAQHAAGLLVLSMLDFRQGRSDSAVKAIDLHISKVGGAGRSQFAGLATYYAQGERDETQLKQLARRLPSTYQVLD